MPTHRMIEIAKAIRKTNPKAAKEYLDYADERERINKAAKEILGDTLEYYERKRKNGQ